MMEDLIDKIPEGFTWYYKKFILGGILSHCWVLNGKDGGIHVDACLTGFDTANKRWYGGIECHTPTSEDNANHKNCWVIGGPCKHDGSSLQFVKDIVYALPSEYDLKPNDISNDAHDHILNVMLHRYKIWIKGE